MGQEFAALEPYHGSFRSCNKAFYTERARRLDHWCGQCNKCCFIDLILAPFLQAGALRRIFAVTGEPLEDPGLAAKFRSLLGAGAKPFECVGEVTECRAAVLLAARRPDRVRRLMPAARTRGRGGPGRTRRPTRTPPPCSGPWGRTSSPQGIDDRDPSSPGPTWPAPGSASGAWAGKATPTCASCWRWVSSRSWSMTSRRPQWTAARCSPPATAGSPPWSDATSWSRRPACPATGRKSPG